MADENIDLGFLAEQGKRILADLAEARAERKEMREQLAGMGERLSGMDAALYKMQDGISELQVSVAAMRADQGTFNDRAYQSACAVSEPRRAEHGFNPCTLS